MLHFYNCDNITETEIQKAFITHTEWGSNKSKPLIIEGSKQLQTKFKSANTFEGLTLTANGFYGPQGRVLRVPLSDPDLNNKMDSFSFNGTRITNLEMETAGIYGLSKLMGHNAISLNAIIANRANGTFSKTPRKTVEKLITYTLDRI